MSLGLFVYQSVLLFCIGIFAVFPNNTSTMTKKSWDDLDVFHFNCAAKVRVSIVDESLEFTKNKKSFDCLDVFNFNCAAEVSIIDKSVGFDAKSFGGYRLCFICRSNGLYHSLAFSSCTKPHFIQSQ